VSLETAIIVATALLCTLPFGWWLSRSSTANRTSAHPARRVTTADRQSLLTELKVILLRGETRASEAERVMRSSTTNELRREGLGPAEVEQLSDVAVESLWLVHQLAFGSDAEASAAMARLPHDARAGWAKIRAKVKRERDSESRKVAERTWIERHGEEYDRLTLVASGGPAIARWLSEQGPTVWHSVGLALRPERVGYAPWLWLSEQPALDRATAAGLFLRSNPREALAWDPADVTGARRDQLALLRRLAKRLVADDFSQRSFGLAGTGRKAYFEAQDKALGEVGRLPWAKLPRHALGPIDGADARTAFVVDGTRVRKRVDLAPYISGQRRP